MRRPPRMQTGRALMIVEVGFEMRICNETPPLWVSVGTLGDKLRNVPMIEGEPGDAGTLFRDLGRSQW